MKRNPAYLGDSFHSVMSILEWLNSNKDWLFEGVGVAAVGGVLTALLAFGRGVYRRWFRPAPHEVAPARSTIEVQNIIQVAPLAFVASATAGPAGSAVAQVPPSNVLLEPPRAPTLSRPPDTLDIDDIFDAIGRVPLTQQDEVRNSFLGLKVFFMGELWSVKVVDDRFLVQVSTP